jgi:hypothetical protein
LERQKDIKWGGYWGGEKRVRVKGPVGECKREREKKKESENSEKERERVPPRRPGESYFEEGRKTEEELRRGRERGKVCALASTLSAETHHVVQEEKMEERERDRARKK